MAVNTFVVLPDRDEEVLEWAADLDRYASFLIEAVTEAKKAGNLYIDARNISDCASKAEALGEGVYFGNKLQQIRTALGRTVKDIHNDPLRSPDASYGIWHLESFTASIAPPIIAEAAERMQQYPSEPHVLILAAQAPPPKRAFLPVFKDAPHISGLPDRFIHLPYVTDAAELALWLKTHHVAAFSLLDKTRFAKTNYIQQGKAVYQEIQTSQYWYLDNLHKDHYEVFDSDRRHLGEADLDGNLDPSTKKKERTLNV